MLVATLQSTLQSTFSVIEGAAPVTFNVTNNSGVDNVVNGLDNVVNTA